MIASWRGEGCPVLRCVTTLRETFANFLFFEAVRRGGTGCFALFALTVTAQVLKTHVHCHIEVEAFWWLVASVHQAPHVPQVFQAIGFKTLISNTI